MVKLVATKRIDTNRDAFKNIQYLFFLDTKFLSWVDLHELGGF